MLRLPEDSLVVDVCKGLGNRLLAIEMAVLLGRELGKRVYISWVPGLDLCNCRFSDLFELPNGNFTVLKNPVGPTQEESWNRAPVHRLAARLAARLNSAKGAAVERRLQAYLLRHFYRFDVIAMPRHHFANWPEPTGKLLDMPLTSELQACKRIYMSTYFNPLRVLRPEMAMGRYNYVRPIAELRERVDEIASGFSGRTVGVHIRWGGDAHYRRQRRHPVSEFVRLMREEVRRDDGVQFYLATESPKVTARLKVLFGDRIVTQPGLTLERDSAAGLKSAVVDIWALSRTRKIINSFRSTFSEVAAYIGGAELHTVDVLARE